MGDRLSGVSLTEADFMSMIQNFVGKGDIKKKVDVEVNGSKEIEKLTNNFEKLNSIRTDQLTGQLEKISTLLSVRFKGVNLNQFTSKLIRAFQDPTKSAEDLSSTINDVYTDLTTLASISNSGSFVGFNESEIRKAIQKQQKVLELQKQFDSEYNAARAKTARQKPVDILTRARVEKIQKQSSSDVATSLGVDSSKIDVKNGDDTLLQNYQQTADLLAKMVSERKEYNKLNKANVGDYLKQEQDILSVFRQLQDIEGQISEKFGISSKDFLSNQFKGDNGQFDFVKNAEQAVKTYVTTMTSSTKKALQEAQTKLSEQLNSAATKSVSRLDTANEKVGKTSERLGDSGVSSKSGTTVQAGTEIGESVAVGMEKAEAATESATEGIKKYILSAEETIAKLKELQIELEELDTAFVDSDYEDSAIEKKIKQRSTESLKYIANLQRLGYSDKNINSILGKTLDDEDWTSYIDTYADKGQNLLKQIRTYVEPEPIQVEIEPVVRDEEKIDKISQLGEHEIAVEVKTDGVQNAIKELDKIQEKTDHELGVFLDSKSGQAGRIFKGEQSRQISASQIAQGQNDYKNKYGVYADTLYHTHPEAKYAALSDTDITTAIQKVKEGLVYIIAQAGDQIAQLDVKSLVDSGIDTKSLVTDMKLFKADYLNDYKTERIAQLKYSDLELGDNWKAEFEQSFSELMQSSTVQLIDGEDFNFSDGMKGVAQKLINSIINQLESNIQNDTKLGSDDFISELVPEIENRVREELISVIQSENPNFDTNLVENIANEVISSIYREVAILEDSPGYTKASKARIDESQVAAHNGLIDALKKQGINPDAVYKHQSRDEYVKSIYSPSKDQQPIIDNSQLEQSKQLIQQLQNQITSLREELQRFKDTGVEPEGITDLQTKLESAEQHIRSLSDELSLLYEHSVSESDYSRLEEELRLAKANADELRESLAQVIAELEHIKEPESQPIVNTPKTSVKDFYEKYGTPSQALNSSAFGGDYDALFNHIGDKFKELCAVAEGFSDQKLDFEFLKELVSQLDLSDEKLKIIQADFEEIATRLPDGRFAGIEPEEQKILTISSRLNDIVSIINGTKIISPQDLSNAELILRYAKEYKETMSRPSGVTQGQEKVDDVLKQSAEGAQQVAQANREATEAAEQRAQANEHLAESEVHVDQAESANNGTLVNQGVEQSVVEEQAVVSGVIDSEIVKFDELKNKIATDIPTAIATKNAAFKEEQGIVEGVVQAEIDKLSQLEGALDGIANAAKNKSEAFRSSEKASSEKTSSNQSNSTGENKTKQKSEQQIKDEYDAQLIRDYNVALTEYIKLEQQRVSLVKQGDVTLSGQQLASQATAFGKMASIQEEWNKETEHSNKLQEEFNNLLQKRSSEEQRLNTEYISNFNAKLKKDIKYSGRMTTYNTLLNEQELRPDAFSGAMEEMKKKAEELKSYFPINPTDEASINRVHQLSNEMEQMAKEIRSNPDYKNATDTAQAALSKKAETWAAKNSAAIKADPEGFERIRQAIRDINTLSEQNEANNMLDQFIAKSNEAGKAGMSFVDTIKKRFVSLGAYLASFASFYRIIGWAKQAIRVITELDTAMMELKKVSSESAKSYSDFLKGSFDQADVVGGNAKQIVESTAAWKRLGKSFEESQEAAQASVKLLNVSEFENIDDATTSLISMRQAFKDNTYDDFIDKLNGVGDSFSSSTDQIAAGMRNISAVLKVQGNDIDQSIALLTAANDITQDMSKASMGVRTIALRISGTQEAKQELEDLGEDTSDFVVQTQSKVDAQVRKYTATAANPNGISVLDETGRLRNTYDILLDISRVYDDIVAKDNEMGTNTSNALLELLAGKTRSNILASILQNPDLLEQAYEKSKNSEGIGQRELDIYLDSIEAKVTQLKNRVQELISTAIGSDFVKNATKGLTKLVELANTLVKTFGTLPTILGTVGGILMQKTGLGILNFDKISKTWSTGGLTSAISGFFTRAFTKVDVSKDVSNFFAGRGLNDKLFGEGGVLAGKGFQQAPKVIQDYAKEMVNAGNATATVGDAIQATSTQVVSFTGLLNNAKNIGLTFASTLGSIAIAMLASMAIQAAITAIHNFIHAEEIAIEKGKEAGDNIRDIVSKLNDKKDAVVQIGVEIAPEGEDIKTLEDSVDQIAEKYSKYHKGVNQSNNERVSLSTEEYEDYLSICNQLADQFPQLVKGYDNQGNAILNLSSNASEAEAALLRMYEAEKLAANVGIGEDAQTSYDGIITQINNYVEKRNSLKGKLDQLNKEQSDILDTKSNGENNNLLSINGSAITVQSYSKELEDALVEVLKRYGVSLGNDISPNKGETFTFPTLGGLEYLDKSKIKDIQEQVYSIVESSVNTSENIIASDINEVEKQISANDLYIEDQKKSITGIINNYLNTSDIFGKQDNSIQNAILANLDNLDLSVIESKYEGDIIPYIYGELIRPLKDEFTPEVQDILTGIFDINTKDIPAGKYVSQIWGLLGEAFEHDPNKMTMWKDLLGFGDLFNEVGDAQRDIKNEFITSGNKMTEEQISELYGLSLDDLRIYADLVRDGVYNTWEELQKAFEEAKKSKSIESTDTLSDLFNSEDYKESAEKYESNLSSLTGALETLRNEGSLTAEEMVKLQESFPDLTEFTTESIQTKAFEELDKWIDKIREGMKDMSDEGKEQARTLIQNMINQYGDMDLSVDDLASKFVKGDRGLFMGRVDRLRSILAENGEEFDTHILFTLLAQDNFSGTADELLAKYKDAKITWEITVEEKDLAKKIEVAQSKLDKDAAKRSNKEAKGEIITPEDYDISVSTANEIKDARFDAMKIAGERMGNFTGDKKSDAYRNLVIAYNKAYQEYIEAETEAENIAKEQAESAANDELQQFENNNNALKEAQNKITEAEKNGGKASADLYESVASQYDDQAEINRKLGDIFQGLADSTDNQVWKTEWTNKANEYYDAALQDEADAKEQKLIPIQNEYNELQNESTAIQHELTEAEQKHQKVSAKTYRDLIANGKAQIKNLQQQQSQVDKFSDEWWNLQNSIDSMSDSMYDWSTTMDSLVYAQAQELASTISTAMSESISETGLSDDTINALKTAFSDLDGSKFDVSDAFYSTADGVKINTEALQELTEAEFELIGAPLANEIANVQAQLDANPGDSALQQKLENLMETNAKYFAQYEEMQKALSRNAAIDLAEGTSNAGANYDKNYGRVKTYKEAREKGLIGTDDFKAWTSYLDVYGRDTIEAYDAISSKIDRYFTEDAADGLGNFLTDMEKLGYAAQDADGYWTITADDYDAAAKDMQMGSEWFMDTMRKLEDFGMIHTYVSSLNEAQLKTRDVEEQIADAVQTYGEMVARGASDEDLQKQIEHINELESQWQDLDTVTKTWGETTEANRKKEFLGLDDQLSAFEEMYKNADTDAGRDAARKAAEDYVKQFGYTLEEGKFKLSPDDLIDYESRTPQSLSEIADEMKQFGEGGNVDLLARPMIDAAELVKAEWENVGDGIATVFTNTYSNKDGSIAMNFTPIITDENGNFDRVLSPDDLQRYAEEVIAGVHGDYLNLQIGAAFTGEDAIAQAEEAAERIHELQEGYYLDLGQYESQFAGTDQEQGFKNFEQYYADNTQAANEYLNVLSQFPRETLEQISLSNGGYEIDKTAEDAFQGLADSLGYTNENAGELLDFIDLIRQSLGEVDVPTQFDTLDNFLANATKGSGTSYQISTDIFGQSAEQLQTQMDEIGTLELQVDPNSDVYEQLQELKEQTEIQLNIKNSEYTQEQLKEWAETGDRQQIANTFGIDVNSEEVDQYIQQIKSTQLDYDMVIHVDDTQFSALMEAITGEPYQANVDITADGSEAEQVAEDTKQNIEKKPIIQTIQQKIQSFGNAVAGLFGGGQQQQQNVKASAQLDTSSGEKELGKFSKDVSNINKTSGTATADINISAAMGKIAILKDALNSLSGVRPMPIIDQSSINNAINRVNHLIQKLNESKNAGKAFGTAYALGTTSLSRAYAGGSQDWTVGRDESALVNEIGQESRVRDGVWELIPGGPHVEDLKKDDIIFNAEQTADLIRTGKTARSGKLVAHANGTVPGMSAYVTSGKSNAFKVNKKKSSSKGNSGGGNGNGGKNNTKKSKNSNKQSAFEKWLEKLFDWIEVRLDRIQRKIDLFTAKAENAIGSLTKAGEAIIGSISSNKNKEVTNAMNKISTSPSQLNNVSIRTNSNGKVIGYTGRPTQNDLLGNSVLGAVRYQKQADKVASKALSSGVFKSKSRKSKSAQQKYMNDLINRIQTGRIDISEYSGDIKKFIDSYKEWYDKSQDLVQSTEELKKQYKELQQQKLDNITDEFETLVGLSEAVKSSSEATIDYFNTAGFAKNTLDREEIKKQQGRQNEITNYLYSEFQTYQKELQNAAKVFGTNSNEYHEAQTKLEEINKSLIESQKTERELSHELYNLGETVRDYFIDRVKSFIDKLGSTGSLAEKRGTNAVYGYKQTEDPYIEQTRYNNELILQYYERIKKAQKEIATQGDQINSDEYEKLYKTITDSESAITSLLSTNEDLKESIRTLRWKGYNDFQEKLNTIKSDLEHLQGFIRDGDILDDDAQFTDLGFAQIALIGEKMDIAENKIRNAQGAIDKLNEEYDNGVISLEKYNEELDAQIDIIQDASGSMFDYQQKLADMYIDQITAENDALQDLISARKDALSAKKEYYDWDKTLRNKNKDIAQLQAQINALQGVSNDAAQARRAKLQAELLEKQEDLQDTLYQHSIELQQEGYDKLSEDMQTALDNAVKLINGDQKVLQETANHMLNQLIASGLEQKDIISSIISDNATRVHDSTQTIIEKLEGEGGVEQLLSDINLSARTIGDAVNARALDGSVSNINTVLSIMQDSLGDDISGQLKAIEFAIGTLSSEEKEKEEQNRQQRKEVIEYQLSDINAQKTAIESNISSHSSSIDEKQAQIKTLENANDAINKNIANLYKSADNSFKQANTLQQQAQDLLKKADKAKKKADKKKYKKQAADKLNQAAAKKVQGNNYIKQYEKAVAAKPAQIKANDNAISSLKEEIASLTNEMNGWENQVADLNKAISVLEEENFELSIPDLLTNGNTAKGITNVSGAYQTPKSLITGYGIINAGNESKSEEELAKEQISSYEDKIKSYEQLLSYLEEASDAHPEFMDDIAKYKANKQKLEEAVEELKNIYGFKKGTKNLPEDLLAWTNENWDKIGPEIIVRPQDNAILTPMKANDSVIPANLADNLFKWGAISPDKFITNPFVGKWDATGSGSSSITNDDSYLGGQTVEMHFDSLFHIEGNVDESVMPRLENLGKSLVNDRDFQKNVIKFVTKDFVRESKKQGIR